MREYGPKNSERMRSIISYLSAAATLLLTCLYPATSPGATAADKPIFMDIRLMAADLVDELVYSWSQNPPLPEHASLVLVDVAAPVGLDERFSILIENRLNDLVQQNPAIPVDLAHCAPCLRLIAKSTPSGTILSRGIDQPEVLAQLLTTMPGKQALSLDFEAAGRELVLRAQIFSLSSNQKIIWARSFTTSMSAQRSLRDPSPLISLEAARDQQRQILAGRDRLEVVSRVAIRNFNTNKSAPVAAQPLPFFEQSLEAIPLPKRRLRAALTLGFTSIASSLSAWSVGGHMAGLLFRDTPSLVNPDLYWTFGADYVRLRGPGALPFAQSQPDVISIRSITSEPKASLVTYRLGLETHIKNRLGLMVFLEEIPILKGSSVVDTDKFLGIPYEAWGMGVVLRW